MFSCKICEVFRNTFFEEHLQAFLFPLVARLWMWLIDMHQIPWISVNILENAPINCFDYVRVLNIPDHLTYLKGFWWMPQALNVSEFWIWHSCLCKGYTEFWICLSMAQYASIIQGYGSICLNVPQYTWTWLNIAECL